MIATDKTWPWKLLLVAILLVVAAGTWGAVQKIDYQWRWYRVPQYFLYHAEDPQKIPFDGVVDTVKTSGKTTKVSLISENEEKLTLTIATDTLRVDEGEDLFEGDTVGFIKEWRLGPLMLGLWTTLWLSAVSSVFALFLGLATGLARISKNFTLRGLAMIYVECIRGTPLLVQIFLAYFFLGTVFNLSRNVCGIGALALFAGAYVAEIVRAGIQAIPKGQTEAARSLGMTAFQTMVEVILPQAFKKILPPLSGQFISLIKDSSLVSVIAITDLTKSGREIITSTFATFEVWLVVAAMYLLITSVLSQVVYYMERRFAISD
ncbi:amino acid ABC transporter permease [Desulforhopalus sp. IMCC35007]|uniref:amino acid ABC transporter permease n=1 Tax=Desulforhopalus sp. IMCC35007 TaxID=2569543 RepID=UPI0010AE905A|nr:amino acid ABC transporter permease [Desulforhopalus sp. IMCC35007]TKB09881.1 amino acid ABC transporter permease [Desulforhopalus sp. IMCC35007]